MVRERVSGQSSFKDQFFFYRPRKECIAYSDGGPDLW
jgi:hypothetical protein